VRLKREKEKPSKKMEGVPIGGYSFENKSEVRRGNTGGGNRRRKLRKIEIGARRQSHWVRGRKKKTRDWQESLGQGLHPGAISYRAVKKPGGGRRAKETQEACWKDVIVNKAVGEGGGKISTTSES